MNEGVGSCAVVYLARGGDTVTSHDFGRFVTSYRRYVAGVEHSLYIIFKGYRNKAALEIGMKAFAEVRYRPLFLGDDGFDIGAYAEAIDSITEDSICYLNTRSEVLCGSWLAKLVVNLQRPGVGLVGATGSFENSFLFDSPAFPNVHMRTNAFMIRRSLSPILVSFRIAEKRDAFLAESGASSLTRQVFALGLGVLVVGRNGRGYPPQWWPASDTFRQGTQENLLVGDNHTRMFDHAPLAEKKRLSTLSWGNSRREPTLLVLPPL